jgi:hypothetical protein
MLPIHRTTLLMWSSLFVLCSASPPQKPKRPRMVVNQNFNLTKRTPLCEIMETSGSDKGRADASKFEWHNYTRYYDALFGPVRNEPLRIFEMGIGTNNTSIPSNMGAGGKPGASLRGWKAYFPKAMVFGADIDKKILFSEDRIETFYCDMTKPDVIAAMWKHPSLSGPLDIMIDDGLHVFEAQTTLLENSLHKLATGGVYIVEDVRGADIPRFKERARLWKKQFPTFDLSLGLVPLPSAVNKLDNNLLVVQRNR